MLAKSQVLKNCLYYTLRRSGYSEINVMRRMARMAARDRIKWG
jgi:hypothetical protein